jgi:Zn-dependent M28 family amino/carboxypeptidase
MKESLLTHLKQIARERDPYIASGGHFLVREYIRQELGKWGLVETHEFQYKGSIHENLILNLPSRKQSLLPPILIAAHYDAVPGTPGADDNATGVAVLLEIAAALATSPLKYPVQLVAFDLEESGLLGSTAYANYLKTQKQSLRLMLSLEMLGYCDSSPNSEYYPPPLKYFYPNKANFIALVGNLTAIPDLIRFNRSFKQSGTPCQWLSDPSKGKLIPQTGFSDHRPFWELGYRAMMITDTAMLRNPHYHRSSDTIATLDLDFLDRVCKSLIQALRICL